MRTINTNSGFSLIEVVLATLILAIGLLGLAQLQMLGLQGSVSAYAHSQASLLAYDMADRIRANRAARSAYVTSKTTRSTTCSATSPCSAEQMAEQDLVAWQQQVSTLLVAGVGTITVTGNTFTISVNWDDNRDGSVDAKDPNFQLKFRP